MAGPVRAGDIPCGRCGAATGGQAEICQDCTSLLRDLIGKLAPAVLRSDREPERVPVPVRDATGTVTIRMLIKPGEAGRSPTTAWDTPSGETCNIPRLLREAEARQVRLTSQPRTKTTTMTGLQTDHTAGHRLTDLTRVVARYTIAVQHLTGTTPARWTWPAIARWLDTCHTQIRLMPWAPDMIRDLDRAITRATTHVDRPEPRRYLGPCIHADGEYWATGDTTDAACGTCGDTISQAARRTQLLDAAHGYYFTAVELERLTTSLGDRIPASTICTWHRRGHVTGSQPWQPATDRDPAADPIRYLVADVLGRLEARTGNRTTDRRRAG